MWHFRKLLTRITATFYPSQWMVKLQEWAKISQKNNVWNCRNVFVCCTQWLWLYLSRQDWLTKRTLMLFATSPHPKTQAQLERKLYKITIVTKESVFVVVFVGGSFLRKTETTWNIGHWTLLFLWWIFPDEYHISLWWTWTCDMS